MNIIVTGCAGFIGSHLLERLLAQPDVRVTGWDLDDRRIIPLLDHPRLTFRQASYTEPAALAWLEQDVAQADWLVHLGAVCQPARYNTEPLLTIHANFLDSVPIVEMASRHGVPLLFTSTSEVYGRTLGSYAPAGQVLAPHQTLLDAATTPMLLGPIQHQRWTYACAKQLTERLIYAHHHDRGLPFAIVRPFNFFGPRMDYLPGLEGEGTPRVLPMFVSAVLRGEPMQLVDGGHARRTITSIHDAIDALMAIIERPQAFLNHFYNIGNPANEVSMRELAEQLRLAFARMTGEARFLDHPIEEVSGGAFYGPGYEDCDRRIMDITQEQARLAWFPQHSLQALLDEVVDYYWARFGDSSRRAATEDVRAL
ncbi:NAD-dependent epimerase/dehydratase family protein [Halomonas tibetensis]|uniref:NAD-dependent epimerase/dehydratase family protein n=1 Tax=Halomonas tibetensis TaxID=2259590 RepID=A0ABV7B8F1_9GAMM